MKFTTTHWLIIIIASIGFLFDTYELLMTPLVAAPAIAELLNVPMNNPLGHRLGGPPALDRGFVWRGFWAFGRLAGGSLWPEAHHGGQHLGLCTFSIRSGLFDLSRHVHLFPQHHLYRCVR
jgi:hypothetical protein